MPNLPPNSGDGRHSFICRKSAGTTALVPTRPLGGVWLDAKVGSTRKHQSGFGFFGQGHIFVRASKKDAFKVSVVRHFGQ